MSGVRKAGPLLADHAVLSPAEELPAVGLTGAQRVRGVVTLAILGPSPTSGEPVRAAVASDGPPTYERKPGGSVVDGFEPRIRELPKVYPTMPATVIAERIGWDRALTVLKDPDTMRAVAGS